METARGVDVRSARQGLLHIVGKLVAAGDSVTPRPITSRKRNRKAHRPLFSLARSLVGQIHGVYKGVRHVRDLLAAEREVVERIALDGESVAVSL